MGEYWNPMVPELSVTDFDRSLRFYTVVLGFSIRIRRHDPEFAYLELNQVQLMIEQINEESWSTGEMCPPFGRGINLQIETPSLLRVHDAVKAAKIDLFRELKEAWYDIGDRLSGEKEFLVQDPDGYLLRFTEHLGEKPKR